MARCGLWHRMDKKIVSLQNGESEGYHGRNKAQDASTRRHACSLLERCRNRKQNKCGTKMSFFEAGPMPHQNKEEVRSDSLTDMDPEEQHYGSPPLRE